MHIANTASLTLKLLAEPVGNQHLDVLKPLLTSSGVDLTDEPRDTSRLCGGHFASQTHSNAYPVMSSVFTLMTSPCLKLMTETKKHIIHSFRITS